MKTAWLDRLLELSAEKKEKNSTYQLYQKNLKDLWTEQNKNKSFLDVNCFISKEMAASFYRIWIENLARQADVQNLRLLKKHIAKVSGESLTTDESYSLQALICFEIGEMTAVKIFMSKTNPPKTSTWTELVIRHHIQTEEALPENLISTAVHDYFLWEAIARFLFLHNERKNLEKVLSYMEKNYKDCPFVYLSRYFLALSDNKNQKMQEYAKLFKSASPQNIDGYLLEAASYLQDKNINEAKKLFQEAAQLDPQHVDLSYFKNILLEKLSTKIPEQVSIWYVCLSARRYMEMQENKHFIFEMPQSVKPHDLVVFGSNAKKFGKIGYKISAFFEVNKTEKSAFSKKTNQVDLMLVKKLSFPLYLSDKSLFSDEALSKKITTDGIYKFTEKMTHYVLDQIRSAFVTETKEERKNIIELEKRIRRAS